MTITAEIIADSITDSGQRITTFELLYPRVVHSEFLTHRLFSRNASSSRAIPVKTMLATILADIARPVEFGRNQSGMQSAGAHDDLIIGSVLDEIINVEGRHVESAQALEEWLHADGDVVKAYTADQWWDLAAQSAVYFAEKFADAGYHKQVCNRIVECFSHIKVVITATSYDNWFHLRNHTDADPTIHVLANCMLAAYKESTPRQLVEGEWHMPYYQSGFWSAYNDTDKDVHGVTLHDALRISSSCTAQVSYRKLDDTLEKANSVYARLVESEPVHASPTEHQATPIPQVHGSLLDLGNWPDGVTHMDRNANFWSGNFCGWIQHRQLIPNHVCNDYDLSELECVKCAA